MHRYERHPRVEFVEIDQPVPLAGVVPNDPEYNPAVLKGWHLPQIGAPEAWAITTGDPGLIIAILDSGVDATHPDLAAKIVTGWNVYDQNTATADTLGHGTWVAGQAAAATNNGVGIASVGWACRIMPIRTAMSTGYTSGMAVAQGITWAADHGVRVANASSTVTNSAAVASAAQYMNSRGGVVTVSSGNVGGFDTSPDNPYVLTVSATDRNDLIPSWVTTGNTVDISAPGEMVYTTGLAGSYTWGTGTSASAPIVAGVLALMLSVNPDLSAAEVQQILLESADDLGAPGWDPAYGWGRVNAARAVARARDALGTPDTTPPTVMITEPAANSMVGGAIQIKATAVDENGIARVDLLVDGVFRSSDVVAPHQWMFDTAQLADGLHVLTARAFDVAGNNATSPSVAVTVDNSPQCECPADCSVPPPSEVAGTTCADGLDNDCDGATDCDDSDCAAAVNCAPPICNANGACEAGENCTNCPSDCPAAGGPACGNGTCEPTDGEDCLTCPSDCNGQQTGRTSTRFCCGDGAGENPVGCSDGRCSEGGFSCNGSPAESYCCGDGICDVGEGPCLCSVDCGAPDTSESIRTTCRDELDNDCDGLADCQDLDCAADPRCAACNNNGVCEPGEDCIRCPLDCAGEVKNGGGSGTGLATADYRFCCGNGLLEATERGGSICDGNP